MTDTIQWLLDSGGPWTRYRTLVDLLDRPTDDPEVLAARSEMVEHPQVRTLISKAAGWPGYPLKRHNDAKHPIYALSTLADFGLRAHDPGLQSIIDAVLAHQSKEGAFQCQMNVSPKYGGTGEDTWGWMTCDAPTLLFALLAMGLRDDHRVQKAVQHLVALAEQSGYRCLVSPELGRFRGPGRKDDPCPIANVYALKALSLVPEQHDSPAAHAGAELLLAHWAHETRGKLFLFGVGRKFIRLKYPYVWFDILHVAEVLSRYRFVHQDPRFHRLIGAITDQADSQGRYTAGSMYTSWKGWSFADKKQPSPWLTFLVRRIEQRVTVHAK